MYFSRLAGNLMNGVNLSRAVDKAADFVTKCIQHAEKLNLAWNWGLPVEEFLSDI